MRIVLLSTGLEQAFARSLGAYQVAHHLRENGYEDVQVLDFLNCYSIEDLQPILDAYLPSADIIGLSTTFFWDSSLDEGTNRRDYKFDYFPFAIDFVGYILENCPSAKIIVGGANSFKSKYKAIADVILAGYSEQEFVDYVKWLDGKNPFFMPQREDGVITIRSNNIIPAPWNHRFHKNDFIFQKETLPIEVSRGCIFNCAFCSYPANGKKKLDYLRSPDDVVGEMIFNYENYKITNYFLCDDTFNDTTIKLKALAERIEKLPFRVDCTAYIRLDLLSAFPEQLELLDKIGVHSLFFGIESMHRKSRAIIGKGADNNRLTDTLRTIRDKYPHWRTHGSFIVGLPYDTEELILEGYELIKKEKLLSTMKYIPMGIKQKENMWRSRIDDDWKSFGYTVDEAVLEKDYHYFPWVSNTGMTHLTAMDLARRLDKDIVTWTKMHPMMKQSIDSLEVDSELFESNVLTDEQQQNLDVLVKNRLAEYRNLLLENAK